MNLTRQNYGTTTVISCEEDRLDALVAVRFKDRFRDLQSSDARRYVLDLSNVAFLDSSGLGAVVAVYKALGDEAALDLAGLSPTVERVLRLTRMDSVFRIYPDVETALTAREGTSGYAA